MFRSKADTDKKLFDQCLSSHPDIDKIQKYLLQGADINYTDERNGWTPLHAASQNGSVSVVVVLLQYQAINVNSRDFNDGVTPLWLACQEGHTAVVKVLLTNPTIKVNEPDKQGRTPLHVACYDGHASVVHALLQHQSIDVHSSKIIGTTPLWIACKMGKTDVVKELLKYPFIEPSIESTDAKGKTPLMVAMEQQHVEIVQLLQARTESLRSSQSNHVTSRMNSKISQKPKDGSVLTNSIRFEEGSVPASSNVTDNQSLSQLDVMLLDECFSDNPNVAKVKEYIRSGAKVNISRPNGMTLLHAVCNKGLTDITKVLLKYEDSIMNINDYDGRGYTPLHYACENGHQDIVDLLSMQHAMDINRPDICGKSPLHIASRFNRTAVVQLLLDLDNKISINETDENHCTPLYIACENGYAEVVSLLLANSDIDVNAANIDQSTPLHVSCHNDHVLIVDMLLKHPRITIDAKDRQGRTPFHIACECGSFDIVRSFCIDGKVSIDALDENKCTPFHSACMNDKTDVAKFVMESFSIAHIIESKTKNGDTPLMIAKSRGSMDLVKLLESRIGNLHLIASCNGKENPDIAKIEEYIKNGADINVIEQGLTPVMMACNRGHSSVVKYLLNCPNIKTDVKDASGWTVLHYACKGGNASIVEHIIKKNRSLIDVTDSSDKTPLSIATTYNHTKIVALLQSNTKTSHSIVGGKVNGSQRINSASYLKSQCSEGSEDQFQDSRNTLSKALRSPLSSVTVNTVSYSYLSHITKGFTRMLGTGGFSTVYKGNDKVLQLKVAVKVFRSDRLDDESQREFDDEVEKLRKLQNPYVVRILGISLENDKKCIVLERASGGAVSVILIHESKRKLFSPAARLYVAQCLLFAVSFLHSRNIFHRDIKTENLCMCYANWFDNPHAVLIDFGIAAEVQDVNAARTIASVSGTALYMAPEYKERRHFTPKSEVFSIGCVLKLLLTADFLSLAISSVGCNMDSLVREVDSTGGRWNDDALNDFAALISGCCSENPDDRPSIADVCDKIKEIRKEDGSLKRLPSDMRNQITKHLATAKQTQGLKRITATHECVICNNMSQRGIICLHNHFICSDGACIEIIAKKHIGQDRIRCPFDGCTAEFYIRDLYEKVNADVYGDLVKASNKVLEYDEGVEDMKMYLSRYFNSLKFSLQQHIQSGFQSMNQVNEKHWLDVKGKLCYVITRQDEQLELSEKIRKESIESFKKHAKFIESQEMDLERRRRDLEYKIESSIGDPKLMMERLDKITQQMNDLSLQQAQGVKYLARGQLQCPRLFVMKPDGGVGIGSKFSFHNKYRLYFICPFDYSLVKTAVTIKKSKDWFEKVAPVLQIAVFTLRIIATAYGVPTPGIELSESQPIDWTSIEVWLRPMEFILDEVKQLNDVRAWGDQGGTADIFDFVRAREHEVSPEAYGAIALEACKPKNLGWMDEMEIASYGSKYEWVKKCNVSKWREQKERE